MEIRNRTPFALTPFVHLDVTGAELLTVALGATYRIRPDGQLSVVESPEALRGADEFLGEPGASSIAAEAELSPPKPGTDVLLRGSAVATRPGTRAQDVLFRAGPVRRVFRVFGLRLWRKRLGIPSIGDPEPFDRVPLVWENAFGGVDESPKNEKHHAAEERNPVGRGFRAKRSRAPWAGEPLPQIEDPEDLVESPDSRPRPVGTGPISRGWLPRRKYAGTYDDRWATERAPLLAEDFDERYHHAAPPGQVVSERFTGGEPVEVVGCSPGRRIEFEVPCLRPVLEVTVGGRVEHPPMLLDTVALDMDAEKLRLVFKGTLRVHGELPELSQVECECAEGGSSP